MRLLIVFVLSSALLSATMLSRTQMLMGTFVTITLPEENAKQLQESFNLIKKIEASLSSYDKNADIYGLNHQAQTVITPYTYEALQLSKHYYQASDGYFDIAIGSITKGLYHFGEDERIVKAQELHDADVDLNGLHFTKEKAWLDKGISIDLGGMGKGFAVDKVADYLHEQNVSDGIVALSGDIRCLKICKMAIQNPFGEGIVAEFTTKVADTAISTSGNYRRYIGTKENNHLIDPKSKASQHRFASITLFSHGRNSDIDAYATAASVMPLEKARDFLDAEGLGYVMITVGGDQYVSDNLGTYVKQLRFTQRVPFACKTE